MPPIANTGKLAVYLASNEWHGLPQLTPRYSHLHMNAHIVPAMLTDLAYIHLALTLLKGVDQLERDRLYMYRVYMEKASTERYMQRVIRLLKALESQHPGCEVFFISEVDHKYYKRGIYARSEKGMKRVRL
jgi:hypothetical protein